MSLALQRIARRLWKRWLGMVDKATTTKLISKIKLVERTIESLRETCNNESLGVGGLQYEIAAIILKFYKLQGTAARIM